MLGGVGSKREEERNEKIIRGLMKLPPNRKCINCNSMGPQYVCTNFWSFVCMTCSGIHREFTHRVKSVSMAKFTSQEVEALQNGGNQRAREIYLKAWDFERQRLPSSSNVDKIRKFIKDVYVDKRYAGEKASGKPPKDMQSHMVGDDETRRASSYHSYSQSPPYDYQYEDWRYGKQAAMLMRKTGSDKGNYDGKMSSFLYSPGRYSEHMYGDRVADEGSVVSDYSTSSAGDTFRSASQSPNFLKDFSTGSPPFQPSRDVSNEDGRGKVLNTFTESIAKKDEEALQHKQRSKSSGSYGSIDSKFKFSESFGSEGVAHTSTESEQAAKTMQDNMQFQRSSLQGRSDDFDLFKTPSVPSTIPSEASSIDLFQSPVVASSDIFPVAQSVSTLDVKLPEFSVPNNEGWATFDSPQPSATTTGNTTIDPSNMLTSEFGKFNTFSPPGASMQWPSFEESNFQAPFSNTSSPWHDGFHDVPRTQSTPFWNAFEDSVQKQPLGGLKPGKSGVLKAEFNHFSSSGDQQLGMSASKTSREDVEKTACDGELPSPFMQSSDVIQPSFTALWLPQGEVQAHTGNCKSSNPFDVPYDSDLEQKNIFPDLSSLQANLPDARLSSSFFGSISEPWCTQSSASPYVPVGDEGGLAYMAAQVPSSQITIVQGPVASFGGNPFA